jgi:hypothetical protein
MSRAVLESALRARKLDRTLTTALPPLERTDPAAVLPTAITALDTCLHGGLPRGQLSEIVGARSSGRTSLLLALCAAATRRGEIAALVDTFDRLDVASVVAACTALDRLLWIRGQAISKTEGAVSARWVPGETAGTSFEDVSSGSERGLLERTIDRALKAFNLVLQSGGFGIAALDFADVPLLALKRIPFTTWLRVQRAIEGSDTAAVIVVPQPLARSAGGVTLALEADVRGASRWSGDSERSCLLAGFDIVMRVVSPRRRFLNGEIRIQTRTA